MVAQYAISNAKLVIGLTYCGMPLFGEKDLPGTTYSSRYTSVMVERTQEGKVITVCYLFRHGHDRIDRIQRDSTLTEFDGDNRDRFRISTQ